MSIRHFTIFPIKNDVTIRVIVLKDRRGIDCGSVIRIIIFLRAYRRYMSNQFFEIIPFIRGVMAGICCIAVLYAIAAVLTPIRMGH